MPSQERSANSKRQPDISAISHSPWNSRHVRELLEGGLDDAKFVFAQNGDRSCFCIAPSKSFHVDLLESVTRELYGESWLKVNHPDKPELLPGVMVQGARVLYDPITSGLQIYGKSLAFGELEGKYAKVIIALLNDLVSQAKTQT